MLDQSKNSFKHIEYSSAIQGHPNQQLTMGRPKGAKAITTEYKAVIVELAEIGVKQSETIGHFAIPQSTVAKIIRKINAACGENEVETRGRKPKIIVRSIQILLSYVRKNRFQSIRFITAKFINYREESISVNATRKLLHSNGIQNKVTATKPYFSTRKY